jgi:hypothetical protein
VGPRRTDIHVLTALSPHPCGSAHSRKTCVQPAPTSRLAVTEPFVVEQQGQIKSRSKASRLKPVLQARAVCWWDRL